MYDNIKQFAAYYLYSKKGGMRVEKPVIIPYEGQNMVGILHVPDGNKHNAWVIMIHGIGDTKSENHRMFVKIARRLAKRGIGSLRIDLLGYGDSEGEFEDMTISGQIDQTIACVNWIRENYSPDCAIGLLGYSLGGCVCACTASRVDSIKSLVLWSPVSDPFWNMLHYMGEEEFMKGIRGEVVCIPDGDALKGSFFKELNDIDPIREIKSYQEPVLLIHGTNDEGVLPINAYRYKESFANSQSTVHFIEGASHRYDKLEHERELLDLTEEWLIKYLI